MTTTNKPVPPVKGERFTFKSIEEAAAWVEEHRSRIIECARVITLGNDRRGQVIRFLPRLPRYILPTLNEVGDGLDFVAHDGDFVTEIAQPWAHDGDSILPDLYDKIKVLLQEGSYPALPFEVPDDGLQHFGLKGPIKMLIRSSIGV